MKGTIGITDPEEDGGAAYAYRGNVYGGGCGTDKYDSDGDETKDAYNPLAGIVRGTTTINITGGQIAHNVYGAGAMGSVGGGADATRAAALMPQAERLQSTSVVVVSVMMATEMVMFSVQPAVTLALVLLLQVSQTSGRQR